MTFREAVDQALVPDPETLQKNIDFLTKIADSLSDEDKKQIEAINLSMKNQQEAAKKTSEKNQKKQKEQEEPQGDVPTTAQADTKGDTAQVGSGGKTAELKQ